MLTLATVFSWRPTDLRYDHATCLDILIDDDTARGVRYVDRHNELTTVTAECEIVLSAGALATPKLLMLSGVGPADHLRALGIKPVVDLPGVGMNLHDHIELDLQWRCSAPVSSARQLRAHNVLMAGARWLLCKSGPAAVGPSWPRTWCRRQSTW
mgnify:CR=1 FL=1